MQEKPTRKATNYRIPFFISTSLCLVLALALAIALISEQEPESPPSITTAEGGTVEPLSPPITTTEAEIVEFLSDDLYCSLIIVRTEKGNDMTVKITPKTTIYDAAGKQMLWSGLSAGMRIRVQYTSMINAVSLYKVEGEDVIPIPPILEECHAIHIVSS